MDKTLKVYHKYHVKGQLFTLKMSKTTVIKNIIITVWIDKTTKEEQYTIHTSG